MRKTYSVLTVLVLISLQGLTLYAQKNKTQMVIDETRKTGSIIEVIKIDKVWSGHPVDFCLLTHGNRQYVAYYNGERHMVVGQRNLDDRSFSLHELPPTSRETAGGTSTVLGWDSHMYITLGIDKEGYIHLSGNMHNQPLTYFRSTKATDISTLVQVMEMVGVNEKNCTYPTFMNTREGELVFHYRDGKSGNGNEFYNIYSSETKKWSRLLDTPLTDGRGMMNAYQSQPIMMADNFYHVYWVWRNSGDCSTNHDLSYIKSPDLKRWYNAFGASVKLPVTFENKSIIVDPIPVKGGIINLSARLCLDENNKPVFVYHKYDSIGNLQFYVAFTEGKKWVSKQLTNWNYRWEFSGHGAINSEVLLNNFKKRNDSYFELSYWHIKYGDGTILLNKKFENCGKVVKPKPFSETLKIEGEFPGLLIQTTSDIGKPEAPNVRYMLKWETLPYNRDRAQPEPWPGSSQLYLYKLKIEE